MSFTEALITGATSGIGEALACLLADKGIALCLSGRNIEKLNALKNRLSKKVSVDIVQVDLEIKEERSILAEKIRTRPIDLVINNAGFGLYGPIMQHSTDELLKIVEVDAVAVLELTLETAKALISSKRKGVIMNISSTAAFHLIPGLTIYAASKAFVNAFSAGLDVELQKEGVRVLASCPGKVASNFASRASKGNPPKEDIFVMPVEFAANEIWSQIVSRKRVHIFDFRYRFATYASYLIPQFLKTKLTSSFMRRKSV